MTPIRPSIINRRQTMPSIRNLQNEDKEFKDQTKFWYKKQEMHQQKKEQVRKCVSPTRDDIFHQQQELRKAMEDQLIQKKKESSKALEDEREKTDYERYCYKFCGPHNLDASITQIKEKKQYLKQLMEENKKRELEKKQINSREKELEIEADHMRAQIPCCWNRRHYL